METSAVAIYLSKRNIFYERHYARYTFIYYAKQN